MIIWVWRFFLYSSVYSCHLFLIPSASVRSIPFLSFIEPIFAWNVPLVSVIFLKISLVFPILLFSSTSLHWSQMKAFLSLLAILWNSAFKWVYLSFSALLFASSLFTAICKVSSDSHFSLLHFFVLQTPSSNNTRENSTCGHHQMVNTEIRLIMILAAKDGEALYSQQKQDRELTVAQIMNSLLPNSD